MASLLEVSLSDSAITFVNPKTSKAESFAFVDVMADIDAIRVVNAEIKGRESVSQASVSLLSHLLDNPRLDEYKGKTPINGIVPKELKSAIRDLETEYMKPIFSAPLVEKGNKASTIEKMWQAFAQGLRDGGGYANAKSRVVSYFAVMGKLPTTDNGKQLTIAAIDKLLANEKAKLTPDADTGIAGKLVSLSLDVDKRTENTKMGDAATAIAALKSMLATYEGIHREALEKLTENIGNPAHNLPQFDVGMYVDNMLADYASDKIGMPELKQMLDAKSVSYTMDAEGNVDQITV